MELNLDLTENQIAKIRNAVKKKTDVTIQLNRSQIGNGKNKFVLTERQYNKLKKAKNGARLELKYKQLNTKSGGFLTLATAAIIATILGAAASGSAAIANAVINKKSKDKQLEEQIRHNKIVEGRGLKKIYR